MNIILINIAHFSDMFLFYFMVKSDIVLVTISNATVSDVFQDLLKIELCYYNYV